MYFIWVFVHITIMLMTLVPVGEGRSNRHLFYLMSEMVGRFGYRSVFTTLTNCGFATWYYAKKAAQEPAGSKRTPHLISHNRGRIQYCRVCMYDGGNFH